MQIWVVMGEIPAKLSTCAAFLSLVSGEAGGRIKPLSILEMDGRWPRMTMT